MLCQLAALRSLRGDHASAIADLHSALAIFERPQDARCTGTTRMSLAGTLLAHSDRRAARRVLLHVLTSGEQLGDRAIEAQANARLGERHQAAGRDDSARVYLTLALRAWQLVANHSRLEKVLQRASRPHLV